MAYTEIEPPETSFVVGKLGARISSPVIDGKQVVDVRLYEIESLLLALCAMHGVEWEDGVLRRGHPKPLPIELKGV